jgi:DNA invertase Pin-like site-specific DNA recombinase
MNAAIYARVSKANGTQMPDNQIDQLTEWANRLGYTLDSRHVYIDRQTGSTDARPALQRALQDAHRREWDVLLVAALDRVSRGGVASLSGILAKLAASGVAIKSLRESWLDSTNPLTSELLVSIFGWLAKCEREQLIERTKAGIARARLRGTRSGKPIGRPRILLDPLRVRRTVERTGSLRRAALALGVSVRSIRRCLATETGQQQAVGQ